MPVFRVTDPENGRTVKLTGDSAPTEQEIIQIFQSSTQPQIKPEPQKEVTAPGFISKAAEFFTGSERKTPETESAPELGTLIGRTVEFDTLKARESFAPQELDAFKQRVEAEGVDFSALENIHRTIGQDKLNKVGSALLITQNPQEQMKIIREQIPSASFSEDEKGNVIVDINGARVPLNKPGFSKQEASQLVVGALAFSPGGKLAQLAPGAVLKILSLGGGAAASQAAIEEAQESIGGTFDAGDVITAGLFAGAFQGLTSAGQSVIRKFINAKNGKFAAKELDQLVKISEKEGVEIFVDDVARTTFVKQIGTTAEKIPITGTVKGRLRQSDQQLAAAKNLKANIVKEIDDTAEEVQRGFSDKLNKTKEVVGRKFAEAANDIDPAGNIPKIQFQKVLDEQIGKQSGKVFVNQPLIDTLEKLKGAKDGNFSQTREILTELNENISAFFKGERELIGGRGVGSLMAAKRALEDDVENFVKSTGTKAGKEKFDEAKKLFIEFEVPFIENKRLARLVKTEEPEDVFNFILAKAGKAKGIQSRAKKAFNLLDDKGREGVKTEIINRAFNDSLKDIGGKEVLSAAQFANNLEKFDNISKVFFNKADKSRIDGIVKLFRATQRASQVAENPPTGMQLLVPGAAIVAGTISPGIASTVMAFGGFGAVTKVLFQTKAGRTLLLGLNKATPGTKLFDSRLSKIDSFLQKVAVPELSQGEDNAKL